MLLSVDSESHFLKELLFRFCYHPKPSLKAGLALYRHLLSARNVQAGAIHKRCSSLSRAGAKLALKWTFLHRCDGKTFQL